jgi:hypothetical protein
MTNFDLHTCSPTDADLWGNLLKKDGCVWLVYPYVASICLALKPTFLTLPFYTAQGNAYRRIIRFCTRSAHCDCLIQTASCQFLTAVAYLLASGKNAFLIGEVTRRPLFPGDSRFLMITSDVRVLFVKFTQYPL